MPKDHLEPEDPAEAIACFAVAWSARSAAATDRGELAAELVAISKQAFPAEGHRHSPLLGAHAGAVVLRYVTVACCAATATALRSRSRPRADRRAAPAPVRHPPQHRAPRHAHRADAHRRRPLAGGRHLGGDGGPLFLEQGLDRLSYRAVDAGKTRLRWQAERPGALWHGDVCHGPGLVIAGKSRPLRIHALLDDASRFVVALEAHHAEREVDMLGMLVGALRRHGAPDALYLDNGPTYVGEALRLGCERLGVTLIHARPYDPQARGKMERFWRTLREGCLDHLGSLTALHDVQVRLGAFPTSTTTSRRMPGSWAGRPLGLARVGS